MWPFSDFQYGFMSSQSTTDLQAVVSDRFARGFNRSGATRAVATWYILDFGQVLWHACLLHKRKVLRVSGQIFGLVLSFLSNRLLWVVLDGKSSQKYPVNVGVPQGSILGPNFSNYALMTLLMMLSVILLSMLMILLPIVSVRGIWSVTITRIGFWTWMWSMRHCGLGQEVACWLQCWKSSTGFVWRV